MVYHDIKMSIRSSLLRGKGTFICQGESIRFETKTDAVVLTKNTIKHTIVYKTRGWIICDDVCHTFKAPSSWTCPWDHTTLDGVEHRGGCVTGHVDVSFFVGDAKHGCLSSEWNFACVQRLSRFSTTFDIVWVDISAPHAFVVTHTAEDKENALKEMNQHVEQVFDLGADPYNWTPALRLARNESWDLDDWLYLFGDDTDDEPEEDVDVSDGDWEPPTKRFRSDSFSSSESDSDDEASSI